MSGHRIPICCEGRGDSQFVCRAANYDPLTRRWDKAFRAFVIGLRRGVETQDAPRVLGLVAKVRDDEDSDVASVTGPGDPPKKAEIGAAAGRAQGVSPRSCIGVVAGICPTQ